jgi:hypothetical protein
MALHISNAGSPEDCWGASRTTTQPAIEGQMVRYIRILRDSGSEIPTFSSLVTMDDVLGHQNFVNLVRTIREA